MQKPQRCPWTPIRDAPDVPAAALALPLGEETAAEVAFPARTLALPMLPERLDGGGLDRSVVLELGEVGVAETSLAVAVVAAGTADEASTVLAVDNAGPLGERAELDRALEGAAEDEASVPMIVNVGLMSSDVPNTINESASQSRRRRQRYIEGRETNGTRYRSRRRAPREP